MRYSTTSRQLEIPPTPKIGIFTDRAACAVVDGYTLDEAHNSSIDLSERLRKHDSSNVLGKLKAAIYTTDTRTNLMDLMIVYVGSEEPSRMQKLRSCRGIEREVLAGLGVSQPEPVSNPE